MGSGGGGTGDDLAPPTVIKAPKEEGPAAGKMQEVGVSYPTKPVASSPKTGLSPGAALAITGSDEAAANLGGRTDINKEQLGDLQTRAAEGTKGIQGTILNTIGSASATRILEKLSQDTPTIGPDGQLQYSVTPVFDPTTNAIIGVNEPGPFGGTVYSGRPLSTSTQDPDGSVSMPQAPMTDRPATILEALEPALSADGRRYATRLKRTAAAGRVQGILLRGAKN